jgi:hypothetical protein
VTVSPSSAPAPLPLPDVPSISIDAQTRGSDACGISTAAGHGDVASVDVLTVQVQHESSAHGDYQDLIARVAQLEQALAAEQTVRVFLTLRIRISRDTGVGLQ